MASAFGSRRTLLAGSSRAWTRRCETNRSQVPEFVADRQIRSAWAKQLGPNPYQKPRRTLEGPLQRRMWGNGMLAARPHMPLSVSQPTCPGPEMHAAGLVLIGYPRFFGGFAGKGKDILKQTSHIWLWCLNMGYHGPSASEGDITDKQTSPLATIGPQQPCQFQTCLTKPILS